MADDPTYSFYAEVKYPTEDVYLLTDGENDFWIPKSQIINKIRVHKKDFEFIIPEWLAIEKGIV